MMNLQTMMEETEAQKAEIQTEFLGHLGLVAGMCDELGLVQLIDNALGPCTAPNGKLSHGERVKFMILNGLGFVSHTLYMYSDYFEDKPLQIARSGRHIGKSYQR